ncbi:MAG: NADPH:quinone oxidoreductase family protein [Alphaproteobacteria bacterium]|uniref:NADPH:quinone oxidoreductase family protein n=1 Tax=Brevundimonas sp. BAL3 TaxID=391600 RepID=UPI00017ED81B|nr:NADPH:quinone oxidoreductase family protein [Brevundimonas sp. BAL3]EDX79506.1 oxidoreductase, zinc-binding dehydrogenase family [Brevundimonas sp. BAL3]PZO09153.1 MAG: NADPH:quinone oxidoreductase family protein [Alphaproteobacteria bacterium]
MKAWVCRSYVSPFEIAIEEIPVPDPGPGEVLIEVAAAGLTFGETLVLQGQYQLTPPLPYVPCSELSGVVRACGNGVTRFRPGDAVIAFSFSLSGGALAKFSVMPEGFVFPKPPRVGFVEAAAIPINFWTAFNALHRRGALRPSETLVVHGATGGVGLAAVQIGKAIGATVIATGGEDAKLEVVKSLGADHVLNHRTQDLREAIKGLTGGRGADVFVDPVGGDLFDLSMRAIAPGGRILVVGFTSGQWAQAKTNILLVKMISVIGVEARLAIETTGGEGLADFLEMLKWVNSGRILPFVSQVFEFEEAVEGFQAILSRSHVGKCILRVGEPA